MLSLSNGRADTKLCKNVECMGIDRGGTRGTSPPPQILSYKYKNECSVAFKICQNPFSAGALPWTPLGEVTTLPRPLSRLEREHPSPYSNPLGTNPTSALTMRPPPRSPARSKPVMRHWCENRCQWILAVNAKPFFCSQATIMLIVFGDFAVAVESTWKLWNVYVVDVKAASSVNMLTKLQPVEANRRHFVLNLWL